ncbi:hypothetical protein ARSEF4850_001221 [Beauveria asiatica]
MKAVLQRVLSGSVTVEKELVSSIGRGVLVFAAVAPGDTEKEMESMANKWKKSVTDISGEVLCVSQFTLLAKTTKGTKPDFHGAANPEEARRLYQYFVQKVQAGYQADRVKDGRFQAMMEVALVNDGPVTLELNVGGKATQDNDLSASSLSSFKTAASASMPSPATPISSPFSSTELPPVQKKPQRQPVAPLPVLTADGMP